ncbi:hypothetical protein OH809_43020 [Streptomyces sp. NBC_00873]|uniref:hypothetical protein n=1 Tax=unclassified Streptomyces TaxID=2593676 RepID=UPI00386AF92E|nr:hypothetical protein OH809_00690 [Streptomyces sp. NBC_00873]WSY96818.1 hypothetical protein OH809_43020 [Streptomyces sp. NBC_00873]WTA41409.1 hypothetical protein OH821_00690 [Streptomyces sp. NBC_00842]WTA48488.1 hypothetical protein OH821_43125 [Streptomyces sp. NBC_00842]
MTFAAEWWAAQQLLPSDPETLRLGHAMAQGWLNQTSALVNEEPHVSIGRLLLLYRLHSRLAKVLRLGFYAALGAMALWRLILISEVSAHGSRDAVTGETVTMVLIATALLLLPFWAVSADSAVRRAER